MAAPPDVRYSLGKKDIGSAKTFSWEYPVPETSFWGDLSFNVGRNFLQSFQLQEIETLPINLDSHDDKTTKLTLLLKLLREKLAKEDAAAAPQTYYDVNFQAWDRLCLATYTIQQELEDPETEATLRLMIEKQKNKENLSHSHTLAALLLKQGKYAEAESTGRPVTAWLDEKLGKDSPQALSSRRMIAEAVWKQGPGRRGEAEQLLAEMKKINEGSGSGQYGVYQEENRSLTDKLIADLKREDAV